MRPRSLVFAGVTLVASIQVPVSGQLRESYTQQQNSTLRDQTERQKTVNIICEYGQFIAPAFGASMDRTVYFVDPKKSIWVYTDSSVYGINFTDNNYSEPGSSHRLTCKPSRGFMTSVPVSRLGRMGLATLCQDNKYVCEYSIEKLGLYLYRKPRYGNEVSRILLANYRSKIEIENTGTYRTCSGYFHSPTEQRICFGK